MVEDPGVIVVLDLPGVSTSRNRNSYTDGCARTSRRASSSSSASSQARDLLDGPGDAPLGQRGLVDAGEPGLEGLAGVVAALAAIGSSGPARRTLSRRLTAASAARSSPSSITADDTRPRWPAAALGRRQRTRDLPALDQVEHDGALVGDPEPGDDVDQRCTADRDRRASRSARMSSTMPLAATLVSLYRRAGAQLEVALQLARRRLARSSGRAAPGPARPGWPGAGPPAPPPRRARRPDPPPRRRGPSPPAPAQRGPGRPAPTRWPWPAGNQPAPAPRPALPASAVMTAVCSITVRCRAATVAVSSAFSA